MGLVLLLEFWRLDPSAPQKRLILPMAVFGLLHGIHEWFELYTHFLSHLENAQSAYTEPVRLSLLASSFLALIVYSLLALQYARRFVNALTVFGAITLPIFTVLAAIDAANAFARGNAPANWLIETLIRYLMGVPGAAIATIGLFAAARKAYADSRRPMHIYLFISSIGLAIYSLSQAFVHPMDTFLASRINVDAFQTLTSIPIQLVRTSAAVIITLGLFLATRFLEEERQQIVRSAQVLKLEMMQQQEDLQRNLLRHVVRAQEEERTRIARELHDEMSQTLTAFSLDLATMQQISGNDQPLLYKTITHLQELGRKMSQDMQRIIQDLRPAHLDELGLIPALKFLAYNEGPRLNLEIDYRTEGKIKRLDPIIETVIFRITQEALINIARHAHTNAACVCLTFEKDAVHLKIIDSGTGFDPHQDFQAPRGWGLAGMKERALSVGANLELHSEAGRGTTIEVTIPYRVE